MGFVLCALALIAQSDADDLRRLRADVQAWFAAHHAATAPEAAPEVDRLRAQVSRDWPRGQRGQQWLRNLSQQQALFAGCFQYSSPPSSVSALPGVSVRVPASYDALRPIPAIVQVWPRTGTAAAARRYGVTVSSDEAIVIEVTPYELQSMARPRPPTAAQTLGAAAVRDAMTVATGALGGRLWAYAEGEVDDDLVQRGLFALLGVVQRHYNIDRERVIMDAAGAACRPVLRAAMSAPDRFAGVILRAPRATQDIPVDNLAGIPVLLLRRPGNGSEVTSLQKAFAITDGQCDVYDVGAVDTEQLTTWCGERRRELLRKHVRLIMRPDGIVDGYWVSVVSADLGTSSLDGLAYIDVVADRAVGRITVQTHRIERFSLLLNDALIDLDRKFELRVNGVQISMRRSRSLSFLCDTVLQRFDPGFLFTTAISIEVPRRG